MPPKRRAVSTDEEEPRERPRVSPHVERQRQALLARFYTVPDILALLNPNGPPVCEKTFVRMRQKGEFPVQKVTLPGRLVVYPRDLVDQWYENDFPGRRTSRPVRKRRPS